MSYRAARDPPLRKIQLDGRNKFSRWLAHASPVSPPSRRPDRLHSRSTLPASFLRAVFVSWTDDVGISREFAPSSIRPKER